MIVSVHTLERADASVLAQIYRETMNATHQGVVSNEFLQSLSYQHSVSRLERIFDQADRRPFCYAAKVNRSIVGFAVGAFALNPPPGYQGELKMLYILPAYQRQGIGSVLISSVVDHFLSNDVQSMFLGVFKYNIWARRFYESIGGKLISEHPDVINGENVMTCTYGWSSIASLMH